MSVLRLARGITGRDKIIKFAGCYHGHVDALLAAAGSGVATLQHRPAPGRRDHPRHARASPRRPPPTRSCCPTTTARRSARPSPPTATEIACRDHRGGAPATWASIPPGVEDGVGFNAFLADIARAHGALFISDEVMTGFRVSRVRAVRPGRRRARPDDLRQGDGRRLPGGGVRRPGRADAAPGPGRRRSTRPAPCRVTRSPPRPAWPRCGWPPPRSTPTSTGRPRGCRPRSPPRSPPPGCRTSSRRPGTCSASSSSPRA